MVAHKYNSSYSGGRDQKECGLRPVRAKHLQESISTNKLVMVVYTNHPSYMGGGGINRRPAQQKYKTLSEN
jgi:hypothetical protein